MAEEEINTFCPATRQEWRQWLIDHHASAPYIWLVYYRKKSGRPSLSWSDAVEEALCFGWIDSTKKTLDDQRFMQFFAKRKPSSTWSKINKEKVQRLIEEGLMTPAGYASVETARQNGAWTILDEAESLVIPDDLDAALSRLSGAKAYFLGLSNSARKSILQWMLLAKRPETRQKRIDEIATRAAHKQKPKQFK
jgi:uncharacterized protein YdeI (YjbR/CyaY-like superfamily)